MPPIAAASLLSSRVATGEELVAAARMVGDVSDFDIWIRRRTYWIEETSELLLRLYGEQGPLTEFRDALVAPSMPAGWKVDLPIQAEQTQTALDRVRALLEHLDAA